MASRKSFVISRVVALVSLLITLIALLQVETTFGLGPRSTYNASSSITIFRNVTLITMGLFGLSFLTRWFAIPAMLTALFGLLATGTYLSGPGSSGATSSMLALLVACAGLAIAFLSGIFVLRSTRRKTAEEPPQS